MLSYTKPLTLTNLKSKEAYQNQIKDTETFSSIKAVPQNILLKNYYWYYIHNSYSTDHDLGRKILIKLF